MIGENDNKKDIEDWTPEPFKIPDHWLNVNFDDLFEILSINGLKIPQSDYLLQGEFPIIDQGAEQIGGYTNNASFVLKNDGGLIIFGDHTRCLKLIRFDFAPGADGIKVLKPRRGLNLNYLFYACTALKLPNRGYSRHFAFLKKSQIPLSPFNEQVRIVAKIEELFSELDNAVNYLVITQKQLAVYYQSVLNDSFNRLTDLRCLEGLLSERMSNGYSGKPVNYETDYRVLSLSATTSGVFHDNYFKYLDEVGLKSKDIWCRPNDILIQRGNTIEYVGVPAVYSGQPKRFIFPDLMIRLRADESVVTTKFLYYALSSPKIRNYLRSKAKGSAGTMPKINQSILASVQVPYCSLDSQIELVKEIERKLSYHSILKQSINECIVRASTLRKSIFEKAFSGQLVSQDPNDEPAGVLLERIRAEKTTFQANTKNNHYHRVKPVNQYTQSLLIPETAV